MNKPVYLGQAILDLSKTVMYEFHYDYMRHKYADDKLTLCYMDTDSLIYDIETDDFYKDIADDVESRFDTSGYVPDRPLPVGKNKKIIGLMKDELEGGIMKEFQNTTLCPCAFLCSYTINLPQLLRSQSVMDKVPAYFKDKEPPIISYQYTNTVANKLFNFSSTFSNLDITNYLSNPQHCQCNTSKFCYEPHSHVITGNLMVIENIKLRELVAKGPKYREPNKINWQSTETMISNSIDLYTEQWSKREQIDLKYLSEWKDQIKELVVERISSLKEKIRSPKQKILSDRDVKDTLRRLHDDFVLVPADKAANSVIVVCKKHYIETLIKELGINTTNISPNSTYIPSTDPFHEILKSHCKFIESLGLEMSEEDKNYPYLYWTPKLHKVPFKHHFIAGSSKCTTKDLSCLLTKVLTTVKDGLIRYNNTKTSRNGVNSMWVVQNSTSLLSCLDQLDVRTATSVQTYDFSTLYTSIPHNLLKSRITALIHNSFKRRNGSNRYTHIKITSGKGYFIDTINPGGDNLYTADQICRMVEFLIDNIFVKFGGCLFRQVIGIPMGTNCAPLLADLFLYSYESEFLDNMIRGGHRKLARLFNLCYRYIDDLIVFNNKKFEDYVKEIYPSQLTVDKANTSDDLANYLDLTFIIESNNQLYTKLYDKRDDFDFHIVNFPFLSSNIPSSPSYGVYISQLIRYARCCSYYDDFGYRHKLFVDRLLSQGYEVKHLRNSFKKFYGRYPDLIGKYQRSMKDMVADSFPD